MTIEGSVGALPGFDAVPGLELVVTAFRKAARAEKGGPGFAVGVSNGEGDAMRKAGRAPIHRVFRTHPVV